MTDRMIADHLNRLKRGMRGCSRRVKDATVMEIAADIDARIRASGGDVAGALASMEDPRDLGRALRAVHGTGLANRLLHALPAPLLGFASFPAFQSVFPAWPVTLFLLLGTLLVLHGASISGRITGAVLGGLVAAPRILLLMLTEAGLGFIQNAVGYESWTIDGGTAAGVLLTSLMLPVIGFLVGKRLSLPE